MCQHLRQAQGEVQRAKRDPDLTIWAHLLRSQWMHKVRLPARQLSIITETIMRPGGQDPYMLFKDQRLLARALEQRTRWRVLTVIAIALTTSQEVRLGAKTMLRMLGL